MTVRTLTQTRRGTIVPMLALCIVALFAFAALAVDLGMLTVARTECQNAADTAALTGCRILNDKPSTVDNDRPSAEAAARNVLKQNVLFNTQFDDTNIVSVKAGVYFYDTSVTPNRFNIKYTKASHESWSAIETIVTSTDKQTFFAKVGNNMAMGIGTMRTAARALAVHRPRDVSMVLDFTGSMGYDSTLNWPVSGTVQGLINPDPAYPKFGHYNRYTYYQNTTPSGSSSTTVTSRPNPLQMKGANGNNAANNHTMETSGGPPLVEDFITAPGDPTTVDATTTTVNAFKMWNPPIVTRANTTLLTPTIYNWTSYNAFTGACPAPDNFDIQSDSPIPYVGDKWPRTDGGLGASSATGWKWTNYNSTTNVLTDNGVKTLQEFLNFTTTGTGGRTLSTANFTLPTTTTGYQHPTVNSVDGGNTNANYRDSIWEAYGYDMDVLALRAQTMNPRVVTLRPEAERFKGYSMGPGYWGKTFFVWPPDPRWGGGTGSPNPASLQSSGTFAGVKDTNGNWVCDWRRRFFLRGDGAQFDPQVDNINRILFRTNNAHVLNAITTNPSSGVSNTPGYYRINYAAIMAWLKSGPQTLPSNLRAGRLLYYSSMPSDLFTTSGGNSLDRTFWREYVHYILGVGSFNTSTAPLSSTWSATTGDATQTLAGVESYFPFDSNSTRQITNPTAFDPNGTSAPPVNPKPYMDYTDEVNRPRAHFWFGPHSMVNFLELKGENRPWWAGTVREAQCWQLKAAVNSALDDIRNNHPNDFVGIAMFANRDHFNKPMAPMSQDWFTLKNVLFFPKDTVSALKANANDPIESRPYTASFDNNNVSVIPNGSGSTDPNSGMAIGFNLLSSSTILPAADYGTRGRRGAAKIVIFETDGIPNTTRTYSITGTGPNTRYVTGGTIEYWTGDSSLTNTNAQAAVAIAKRVGAMQSDTAISGYSTPSTPARVYAIGFGYLFNGYDGTNFNAMNTTAKDSLRFLLRMQQQGNTSGPGNPPTAAIPFEQVITGPYQRPDPTLPEDPVTNPAGRIEKLRLGLERIMQSGVQVTLVE